MDYSEILEDHSESPAASPFWKRLGRAVVVVVVLALGWYGYSAYCAGQRLARAVAEADRLDPGWRVEELEAERPPLADDDNGLVWAHEAVELLPRPWPDWNLYAVGDTSEQAEKDCQLLEAGFNEIDLVHQLGDRQTKVLKDELARAERALLKARELADLPEGRCPEPGNENLSSRVPPHLEDVRRVSELLAYDVLDRAQEGDLAGACLSCRAILNAGRAVGDEPTLTSQRVRLACRSRCVRRLERVLAQSEEPEDDEREVSEDALARMQQELQEEAEQPVLLTALRGTRARADRVMQELQEGAITLPQVRRLAQGGPARARISLPDLKHLLGAGSYRASRAALLETLNEVVEAAKLPVEEQKGRLGAWKAKLARQPPLVHFLVPDVTGAFDALRSNVAEMRCAVVLLAAERFRLEYCRWPQSQGELVPLYLAHVQADPFDGALLRLRRTKDGLVVYSVGGDGQDDGGRLGTKPDALGWDWGLRLYDEAQRRGDPVGPAATRPRSPGRGAPVAR